MKGSSWGDVDTQPEQTGQAKALFSQILMFDALFIINVNDFCILFTLRV